MSTLDDPAVRAVLDHLHRRATEEDPAAAARVRAREAEVGYRLTPAERYVLYDAAPLAISAAVGRLYYVLARGAGARSVVEFGMSHGVSTIYLAAALRDNGGGRLITTEVREDKVALGRANLAAAGLDDLVEIRVGDALKTLRGAAADLLVLDGRNDQYVPVLKAVSLRAGGLVLADLGKDDPDLEAYQAHVRARFVSLETAGIEITVMSEK